MSRIEAVHIGALSFWLAALVVGASAAILGFGVMRQSDPALPAFAAYEGEHWRLLAGMMAERVFGLVDAVGVGAVVVAAMTLAWGVARGLRVRTLGGAIRTLAVLVAAALLSANVFLLRPLLGQEVRAYREAAEVGDTQAAMEHRDAYDRRHAIARALMTALAGVVAVALVGAIAGGGRPPEVETR